MEKLQPYKKVASLGLLGAIAAGSLTGCHTVEIENDKPATVIAHGYRAPYTSYIWVNKIWIPQSNPAEYKLEVRQCDRAGDKGADADGCVTDNVRVDPAVYYDFKDGDTIIFGNN